MKRIAPFRTMDEFRDFYTICKQAEREGVAFHGCGSQELFWNLKLAARDLFHKPVHDPLAKSIREAWRHNGSEDGESGVDYIIIPDEGQTDEELDEFVKSSEVYYPPICGPYDCTGKRFTWGWAYTRWPCGIVIIHRWGLDV